MRNVPDSLLAAWNSNTFIGQNRYALRVTIQKVKLAITDNGDWTYASVLFPQVHKPRELPNCRRLTYNRDTQAPKQSGTLELYNYKALGIGEVPPTKGTRFGQPGYYTPRRGLATEAADLWSQTSNEWRDWLVYDRVIRTYEGYGFDDRVAPEDDPHLVLTGTWLTTDIDFDSTKGVITVTIDDLGRMLTDDNLLFPPVVPVSHFPLEFSPRATVPGPDVTDVSAAHWTRPTYKDDSGVPYNGPDGVEWGHRPDDAFDDNDASYWLSIGNESPDADYAYEFVEGAPQTSLVLAVSGRVWGGPYTCYLSIHTTDKGWLGRTSVPYNPKDPVSAPNGAHVPYVQSKQVSRDDNFVFNGPTDGWNNVDGVRVTFHHLTDSGIGPFPYRAGVRSLRTSGEVVTIQHTTKTIGYNEYTDIIKILCGMGGFFWPSAANKARVAQSDGSIVDVTTAFADTALGGSGSQRGRIWGDLQNTGVGPITSITPDQLDKQPIYAAIQIIQETVGFLFYIDETGGVIWRMPNTFQLGNWVLGAGNSSGYTARGGVSSLAGLPVGSYTPIAHSGGRTSSYVTVDDKHRIQDLNAKLSGRNVREKVFVGNLDGTNADLSDPDFHGPAKTTGTGTDGVAAITDGINPYPSGFRRVAGWLDQHFESVEECQRMADLIVLAQALTLWTDTVVIAGNPQIQIDDQILVTDEVSADVAFHYVSALQSEGDMEKGSWTYSLTTNQLGIDPSDPTKWVFDASKFSSVTTTYLAGLGLL